MSVKSTFTNRRFSPLFWTQFFGALNDNYFKNAFMVLVTFRSTRVWGLPPEQVVALAGGIFILPFLLFSGVSGVLADRYEKALIARITKWFELIVMIVAIIGFYNNYFSVLLVALFSMGLHSTLFGPVKYSIIPELVEDNELTTANALVETGTFIAILVGTIAAGVVASLENSNEYLAIGLLSCAIIGIYSSQKIPAVGGTSGDEKPNEKLSLNPFQGIWSTLKYTNSNVAVYNSCLGISWFWFIGAALISILPILTKNILLSSEGVFTFFFALFTIGIAAGALACEKFSHSRVEIGLVPFGSLGMSLFLLDFAYGSMNFHPVSAEMPLTAFFHCENSIRISIDLFLISAFGGIYSVPLYTLIQERSERKMRSRVVAANNIMNSLFMVVSSLILMSLYAFNVSIPEIIILFAILNILVSIYIYKVVPEFTLRFLAYLLARCLYRIKVEHHDRIPNQGAALLVCNHVSYVDWLVIYAAVRRPIRFVMYYKFGEVPFLRYLFRHAEVIPIAGATENPAIFNRAFDLVAKTLDAGELVCIFPEGAVTHDGLLQPFRRGVEHILKRNPVPVVPMALKGLWGSFFSRKDGLLFKKIPRNLWEPLVLEIGEPVPPALAKAEKLQAAVTEMLG